MIGRTISHYKITERLGEGGMGVVYRARDLELDRFVAIKFLPPHLSGDKEARERFVHEAKAASALNHPNIAVVHEIGESDDGQIFIVMACYEAESLRERIDSGGIQSDEALDIAGQIASGLGAAHKENIVHRDLKPSNILVTGDGRAVIIDFGLAKLAGRTRLTREGTTVGTAAYTSPEQAKGEETDHRSDIFSFGCVFYELLCGSKPFSGEHEAALLYEIVHEEPGALDGCGGDIPEGCLDIINRCLKKDPAERYQNTAKLKEDIRKVEKDIVATVPGPQQGKRSVFRSIVIAAAAVMLVVVGLYFIKGYKGTGPDDAGIMGIVVLPFENLGDAEDEYFADGITDEITIRLAGIESLKVIARTSANQFKNTDKTIARIGEELDVEYILEGTIRWQRLRDGSSRVSISPKLIRASDGSHIWVEIYQEDIADIFEVQSLIATRVAGALGVELLESTQSSIEKIPTENLQAYDYYLRGLEYDRFWAAPSQAGRALQMYEKAVSLDPKFAEAWAHICRLRVYLASVGIFERHELASAKYAGELALSLDEGGLEPQIGLGFYYYSGFKDYDNALKHFERAKAIAPGRWEAIYGSACVLRRMDMWEMSSTEYEKALKIDPLNWVITLDLAYSSLLMRDFENGEKITRRLIDLNPDLMESPSLLIDIYLGMDGDTTRAAGVLRQALARGSTVYQINDYEWSAHVLRPIISGNEEAISQIMLTEILPDRPLLANAELFYMKAFMYGQSNKSDSASVTYEKVLELIEPLYASDPETYKYYPALILAYSGLGRHEESIALCRKALMMDLISRDVLVSTIISESLAMAYSMADMENEAIDLIEELLSRPSRVSVGQLKVDPVWDPIRDNTRFINIVESRNN